MKNRNSLNGTSLSWLLLPKVQRTFQKRGQKDCKIVKIVVDNYKKTDLWTHKVVGTYKFSVATGCSRSVHTQGRQNHSTECGGELSPTLRRCWLFLDSGVGRVSSL